VGGGGPEWRNGLWRVTPSGGHGCVCEGDNGACWGEEGEPWDGRDQTIVFQVSVSFL
jgi:hypothetical protein